VAAPPEKQNNKGKKLFLKRPDIDRSFSSKPRGSTGTYSRKKMMKNRAGSKIGSKSFGS